MKFNIHTKLSRSAIRDLDAILVPVLLPKETDKKKALNFPEVFTVLDRADQNFIKNFISAKGGSAFGGKALKGESRLLAITKDPGFVFLGFDTEFNEKKIAMLTRKFVRTAKAEGFSAEGGSAFGGKLGIYVDDFSRFARSGEARETPLTAERVAHIVAENALLAHYDFSEQFKTPPKEGWKVVSGISIFTLHDPKLVETQVSQAELLAEAVNECRTLANMPPSDLKPEGMAEAARSVAAASRPAKAEGPASGGRLTVTVFDEKRLKAEGMNAILSVGQGSVSPPRLIIMEYRGSPSTSLRATKTSEAPLVLVGKGVTFDSGGLNLKPGEHMADMHMDMSGGAAVIYAMSAIAKMKLPINVIGLIPAVENMPSGLSYRQGDIVKAYGGKTIEIGNTDAEGRVILADAIEYAKTKKPALIVTIATLTGAAMSALGQRMSALFVKNNKPLEDALRGLGDASGDLVWPLPLWEEHEKDVEGNLADVTNTSKTGTRYGWALLAAAFLSHFAKGVPFAHLDMAPRMTANPDEELSKGAIGFGVRYFVELARQWDKIKKLV